VEEKGGELLEPEVGVVFYYSLLRVRGETIKHRERGTGTLE
jgi:hypothetical protein